MYNGFHTHLDWLPTADCTLCSCAAWMRVRSNATALPTTGSTKIRANPMAHRRPITPFTRPSRCHHWLKRDDDVVHPEESAKWWLSSFVTIVGLRMSNGVGVRTDVTPITSAAIVRSVLPTCQQKDFGRQIDGAAAMTSTKASTGAIRAVRALSQPQRTRGTPWLDAPPELPSTAQLIVGRAD